MHPSFFACKSNTLWIVIITSDVHRHTIVIFASKVVVNSCIPQPIIREHASADNFGWAGSVFNGIVKHWDLLSREPSLVNFNVEITKVGTQAYLPDMFGGWSWVYVLSFAILGIWYLLVRYNESTEKFTIF